MTDSEYRAVLVANKVPFSLGDEILDARYIMSTGDWYAKTDRGWFWWCEQRTNWEYLPNGPVIANTTPPNV